jgi:hypothetical protein
VFFSFFFVCWQESTLERFRRGGVYRSCRRQKVFVVLQFFNNLWGQIYIVSLPSSWHAPSSLVRRCPLVQPLLDMTGKLIGDWRVVIMRQGVPHTLGRAWWPRPVSFAMFGGGRGFLVIGCCRRSSSGGKCVTRAVSGGVFFQLQLLFWVFSCIVFLLTICCALVLI